MICSNMFYLARGGGRGCGDWCRVACFNQPADQVELELLVLTLFNDASSSSTRIAQHFNDQWRHSLKTLQKFSVMTVFIIFTFINHFISKYFLQLKRARNIGGKKKYFFKLKSYHELVYFKPWKIHIQHMCIMFLVNCSNRHGSTEKRNKDLYWMFFIFVSLSLTKIQLECCDDGQKVCWSLSSIQTHNRLKSKKLYSDFKPKLNQMNDFWWIWCWI